MANCYITRVLNSCFFSAKHGGALIFTPCPRWLLRARPQWSARDVALAVQKLQGIEVTTLQQLGDVLRAGQMNDVQLQRWVDGFEEVWWFLMMGWISMDWWWMFEWFCWWWCFYWCVCFDDVSIPDNLLNAVSRVSCENLFGVISSFIVIHYMMMLCHM